MPFPPGLQPALVAYAVEQRGVFTAAQARAAGHTEKELQRLRSAGDLESVRRGVYADGRAFRDAKPAQRLSFEIAALAVALSAPAVLSHQSAAFEQGLELLEPDHSLLHVTRPTRAGTRKEAGVDHHVAELRDDDILRPTKAVMPMTSLPRTAMDVARETDRFECALAVFDSALRAGVSRDALARELDLARSWPGARLPSRAVQLADGRAANPGESWSRAVLLSLGHEPQDLQKQLVDAAGLIGYVDFWWDGVVAEFDGRGKYGVDQATDPMVAGRIVFAEKQREDRIRRLGYGVARWGWAELRRPAEIARRMVEARESSSRPVRKTG